MNPVHIVISTRAHPSRGQTLRLLRPLFGLPDVKIEVVTHNAGMRASLIAQGHDLFPIHLSGIPRDIGITGMVETRDWVTNNLGTVGEWITLVDDNISHVERVDPDHYGELGDVDGNLDVGDSTGDENGVGWREIYGYRADPAQLIVHIRELIELCEDSKTILGGFGYLDNPFFRGKKINRGSYVKGKMYVHKPDGVPYRLSPELLIMSDFAKTLDVLTRYGSVVVNDWVRPVHERWQEGGIGSLAARMPYRLTSVSWMAEHWEGLVRITRGESGEDDWMRISKRPGRSLDSWRAEWGRQHPDQPMFNL